MSKRIGNEWEALQSNINTCKICLSESLFQQVNQPPARPWNPLRAGRLLFLSEYPPSQGGFWKVGVEDKLRKYLFEVLARHGYSFPANVHSPEALHTFLSYAFFLIQTLKWPLRQGLSFNSLAPDEQQRLITHVAEAHLRREIELCAPQHIVALGNAAWQACAKLSAQSPLPSPEGGVKKLHSKDYQMILSESNSSKRDFPACL